MINLPCLFSPLVLGLSLLAASAPVRAHEFWLEPVGKPLKAGASVELSLYVGEFFDGVLVGFSAPQTASLKHIGPSGTTTRDLMALVPPQPVANLKLPLGTPGTHLIAFDSQPSQIELPAGQFHAYLHDEGLDFIKAQCEAAGTADKPGRERYRRHVKTLLAVGHAAGQDATPAGSDKIHATRVGQRLELVPLNDPLRLAAGGALGLQLLFEGKPLQGALVKAWHKQSGQTLIIRAITTARGKVTFNLPYAGAWMVSVVHMVPAGAKDIDWDSLWANLSFVIPERSQRR